MTRKIPTPLLILLLLGLSAILYLVQYLIFRRPADSAYYFLQDLAFVPISVLLVTLGLNTVLVYREKQEKLEKVGIVVNEFFAEAGNELIMALKSLVPTGYFWWNTCWKPPFLAVSVQYSMDSWASSWLIWNTAYFLGLGSGCSRIISKTMGEKNGVLVNTEKRYSFPCWCGAHPAQPGPIHVILFF